MHLKRCLSCGIQIRSEHPRCDPCRRAKYRPKKIDPAKKKLRNQATRAGAVLKAKQSYCRTCGFRGDLNNPLVVDHIIPLAKGGDSSYGNLQILCARCNNLKGAN